MRNNRPIIIGISLILAVVICVLCFTRFFIPTTIGVRMYQGPRLTIQMHISVDGKSVDVIKTDESKAKLKNKGSFIVLTDRMNAGGEFIYRLKVKDIPITLDVYHYDWWEVIESNLYIDINTKDNTYTISENYLHTQMDNFFFNHRVTEREYPRTFEGLDNIYTVIAS